MDFSQCLSAAVRFEHIQKSRQSSKAGRRSSTVEEININRPVSSCGTKSGSGWAVAARGRVRVTERGNPTPGGFLIRTTHLVNPLAAEATG